MSITKFRGVVVGVSAALLLVGAAVVDAQQAQLSRIRTNLSEVGFASQGTERGSLNESESTTYRVWLRAGAEYTLRGTCDEDCPDLDLELRTVNGLVVDSDYGSDDTPVVEAFPETSAWYTVEVIMASCSIEPCRYAVGTFRR